MLDIIACLPVVFVLSSSFFLKRFSNIWNLRDGKVAGLFRAPEKQTPGQSSERHTPTRSGETRRINISGRNSV